MFVFSGCGGNGNRFDSLLDCHEACLAGSQEDDEVRKSNPFINETIYHQADSHSVPLLDSQDLACQIRALSQRSFGRGVLEGVQGDVPQVHIQPKDSQGMRMRTLAK